MAITREMIGRLAPSPTGALHLGNARTFLLAWLRCRQAGGRMILRLEDLDHPKVKAGAAEGAYEDLRWLGLDWDEGPDRGGPHAPYVQSQRLPLYREALATLAAAGLLYPCCCTRKDVEAAQSAPHQGEEQRYPGTCRGRWASADDAERESGRPPALRFRVDEKATAFVDGFLGEQRSTLAEWSGDFVIARGPELPGYQLAVVVDDAAMGVTEVLRADDLVASTHRQLVLYEALSLRSPTFFHVPLVVGPDGRRLAKRHGDTRIASLREAGVSPARVIGWLAHTCGWADPGEELQPTDLLPHADWSRLPHSQVVYAPADERALLGDAPGHLRHAEEPGPRNGNPGATRALP